MNPQNSLCGVKLVKRRFRLVLGIAFAALGADLFVTSLIAALDGRSVRWVALIPFGVFGLFMVIAGTAMCFEKKRGS